MRLANRETNIKGSKRERLAAKQTESNRQTNTESESEGRQTDRTRTALYGDPGSVGTRELDEGEVLALWPPHCV